MYILYIAAPMPLCKSNNTDVAVARAKKLCEFQNPSTGIYKLIEMLSSDARQSLESEKSV